jgi:L-ribulose-5-phosphate 4-epimerase
MHEKLKADSYRANILLPKFGIVNLTFGNVSVCDRQNGVVAIKPSGVSYDELKPEHIVIVDLNGKKIEGDLNPSSDTPTHCCLYRNFPEIASVVHTHSIHATGFAQAGMPIPCLGTTHSDYFFGEIPVTRKMKPEEIAAQYELETGNVIVERFRNLRYQDMPAVLVHSHGPFAWGPSGEKAVENAFAAELVAHMAYVALTVKNELPSIQRELLEKHFLRKHGKNAYYGQKKKS